jgi:hypothetical protein
MNYLVSNCNFLVRGNFALVLEIFYKGALNYLSAFSLTDTTLGVYAAEVMLCSKLTQAEICDGTYFLNRQHVFGSWSTLAEYGFKGQLPRITDSNLVY